MSKKSLVKNSFFNVMYKGLSALFPLITATYISRTLLPDRVGLVSYANTIVTIFVTLAALGIPSYGVKAIAKYGDNEEKRNQSFFELLSINSISTTIFVIVYYTFVNFFPYFSDKTDVLNVMGLLLILNYFNVDWFYQGIEEYKFIAVRSIAVKIATLILIFILVKGPEDYLKYALILCIATAGNYLLNFIFLRNYISIKKYSLHIFQHLMPIFILLASSIATEMYKMVDTIMLEYFHSEANVAYYNNGVKVVTMVYTMVIAMVATFYPRISYYVETKEYDKSNYLLSRGFEIILFLSLPCVGGLFASANEIVRLLYGVEYLPSIPVLRIASILVLVFSTAYLLGHIVLMAAGKEKSILISTVCGAVVNLICNILLIPTLQQNGAVIASVVSEFAVTSVLLVQSHKFFKININTKDLLSEIIGTVLMICLILFTNSYISSRLPIILSSLAIVLEGVLIYVVVLIILRNSQLKYFSNLIKKKLKNNG